MKTTTSRKEVRQFVGVVNYFRNMWARCSHELAPLSKITHNKAKLKSTQIEQYSFDENKWIMTRVNLFNYPVRT